MEIHHNLPLAVIWNRESCFSASEDKLYSFKLSWQTGDMRTGSSLGHCASKKRRRTCLQKVWGSVSVLTEPGSGWKGWKESTRIAWLELVYGNDDDCNLCSRRFFRMIDKYFPQEWPVQTGSLVESAPAELQPCCPGAVVGFVQSCCSTATGAVCVSGDRRQNHLWLCLPNAFAV